MPSNPAASAPQGDTSRLVSQILSLSSDDVAIVDPAAMEELDTVPVPGMELNGRPVTVADILVTAKNNNMSPQQVVDVLRQKMQRNTQQITR